MASPQRNPKDLKKMIEDTKQDMGDVHRALEKLRNLPQDERTEAAMLWSRIDEQSSLICILKQRADELLLRCQALEQINMELEDLRANVQTELENERKRSKLLEERFMDLAANHQELIHFKDEYKQQNLVLVDENKRLQEENAKHFCKELQEKEAMVSKLTQELRDLAEQHKNLDTEYKDKTTGFQIKLKELISLHQKKEASLQDELHDTQKQLQNARDMFTELGLKLKQTKERDTKKETETHEKVKALTKEKNNLLDLSIQKEKMIQDKQAKIQQLEQEKQEAEEARVRAVDRFEREAAAVDGTLRVQELQHALEKAEETCSNLKKGFEAYKKHSSELLAKEKELNARLRHMTA